MARLNRTVFVLAGPTASGKTEVAVETAALLDAEIINVDSRQVYRGLDIGTAKPTREQRATVPFHMVDIVEPVALYSAADFGAQARLVAEEIWKRGKRVLAEGGSGLYFRAFLEGLFDCPPVPSAVRENVKRDLEKTGLEALVQELERVDPVAARRIDRRNPVRVCRAVEVFRATGVPLSKLQEKRTRPPDFNIVWRGLRWPREELYYRINQRTRRMLEGGWVDEVRALLESRPATRLVMERTLGYREIVAMIDGSLAPGELCEKIARRTRNYAKRQMTWFRANKEITWISCRQTATTRELASRIHDSFMRRFVPAAQ